MSNFLWPQELQHIRLPCPSLSPGVCSNSYPLSQWCYLTISSFAAPFSCPQSFPVFQDPFQWVSSSLSVGQSIEVHLKIILGSKVQGENINAGVTISSYAVMKLELCLGHFYSCYIWAPGGSSKWSLTAPPPTPSLPKAGMQQPQDPDIWDWPKSSFGFNISCNVSEWSFWPTHFLFSFFVLISFLFLSCIAKIPLWVLLCISLHNFASLFLIPISFLKY